MSEHDERSAPPTGEPEPASVTEAEREAEQAEVEAAAARDQLTTSATLDASVSQRLVQAVTGTSVVTTLLAIFSALVVGAVVIIASDDATREAMTYFTARPADTFAAAWTAVGGAYGALLRGSLGGGSQLSETLVAATPLILTGLAVAIPLRAGLFNIGAEGQLIAGALTAALVGFSLSGLPLLVHLPLAVLGGVVGGFLYGWLPGILKARTGAHEVITTIMLNNIAILGTNFLLTTALFRRPDRTDPISRQVDEAARLPRLPFLDGARVNWGLVLALLVAIVMFWFLERSTRGFEINAVGQNPDAATSAGMNPGRVVILAMAIGGALAGTGGAAEILGIHHRITPGFSAGLGFDGITVALLGRGGIGGTVAAGLLFGALRAGGRTMQISSNTSLDLVVVIQALIIVFIAAPGLVRAIYRIKTADTGTQIAKGWGS